MIPREGGVQGGGAGSPAIRSPKRDAIQFVAGGIARLEHQAWFGPRPGGRRIGGTTSGEQLARSFSGCDDVDFHGGQVWMEPGGIPANVHDGGFAIG